MRMGSLQEGWHYEWIQGPFESSVTSEWVRGIEPPVKGQRPKTDQRLVAFTDTHQGGGTGDM